MEKSIIEKKFKVIDMMVTMHSILADRYTRKAKSLEILMFAGSIILLSVVFLDPAILSYLDINQVTSRIIIGIISILFFFISILSLIFNWNGKSEQHRNGFNELVKLKTESKNILDNFENLEKEKLELFWSNTLLVLNQQIPIPHKSFNKLKHKHYKKVELSKMISKNPGCNLFFLKLKLLKRSFSIFSNKCRND